jgi:hypothetical protein
MAARMRACGEPQQTPDKHNTAHMEPWSLDSHLVFVITA